MQTCMLTVCRPVFCIPVGNHKCTQPRDEESFQVASNVLTITPHLELTSRFSNRRKVACHLKCWSSTLKGATFCRVLTTKVLWWLWSWGTGRALSIRPQLLCRPGHLCLHQRLVGLEHQAKSTTGTSKRLCAVSPSMHSTELSHPLRRCRNWGPGRWNTLEGLHPAQSQHGCLASYTLWK